MNLTQAKTYAVIHKDYDIRMNSRSGGVFTAISDYVLGLGGAICGVGLDENFLAYHSIAWNKEERDLFRGSKYIQSSLGDVFKKVENILKDDKYLLFSGTSCQVDGLLSYLKICNCNMDKLITVDLVCHGVPSPKVWQAYLEGEEKKHGKIIKVDFRNKKDFGWHDHYSTVYTKNSKYHSEQFTKLFYGHYILRPSCYKCPYTTPIRISDFTLADFWGIEDISTELTDNKGVSLLFVNNKKSEEIFLEVENQFKTIETKFAKSIKAQPNLSNPSHCPENRKEFWDDFKNNGYSFISKKYGVNKFKSDLKREFKVVLRKLGLRKI